MAMSGEQEIRVKALECAVRIYSKPDIHTDFAAILRTADVFANYIAGYKLTQINVDPITGVVTRG